MARASDARQPPAEVAAEPPESYQLRQENELQALESIYGQDFQDLRRSQAWKLTGSFKEAVGRLVKVLFHAKTKKYEYNNSLSIWPHKM